MEHVTEAVIRTAVAQDVNAILAFDAIAQQEPEREVFICRAVDAGVCTVVTVAGEPVAYSIVGHHFFGWPFIEMVYVRTDCRQHGYATALMRHAEAACGTEKLFTSTNLSNLPMQRLLAKLGYVMSGVVHNLDEGDPEVIFFKRPAHSAGKSGYNTAQQT